MHALEQSDVLDQGIVGLIRNLRSRRNEATHASDFALSERSARDYAEAAGRVTWYLRDMADGGS